MTRLYEAADHVLIHTGYSDPAAHRHMAAHIIISFAQPMRVTSGDTDARARGVMIPSGAIHRIDTHGDTALVFLFDCTTAVAARIPEIRLLPDEVCDRVIALYNAFAISPSPDTYRAMTAALFSPLGSLPPRPAPDDRIESALRYIRAHAGEKLSCRAVAAAVHLSESRFSHLFRQQIGMTFAAYRVYQQLMCAYAAIIRGNSITDAALAAGFSDSAHFADVNRRVFGLPASRITENITHYRIQ